MSLTLRSGHIVAVALLFGVLAYIAPTACRAQARRSPSLGSVLDSVVWDPGQRGPLLIVAPETTMPDAESPHPSVGGVVMRSIPQIPRPDANGDYRLGDLTGYFGRKVIPVGKTITVFAPATMAILATRLPKPDGLAGMGRSDTVRFFQSTLTTAQWRLIGSEQGIGLGDLDKRQRDIFLALLPDPIRIQPVKLTPTGQRMNYFGGSPGSLITLTGAQRQGVRLSMRRTLDWMLPAQGDSNNLMRFGIESADDGTKFEVTGDAFGSNFRTDRGVLFGLRVIDEVPNRAKPGQLPFDWAGLDTLITLDGAKTVGEMVARVAGQSRVELFCDPRYADLTVWTRGSGPVRAGDLLKALCLCVTGTFRKVGDSAFVMTDDLEGLGARQARLEAWLQASAVLSENRHYEVEAALARAHIGDHVGWANDDPMRPGGALAQQIEAQRTLLADPKRVPTPPEKRASDYLFVPVSELPPAAQQRVQRQKEAMAKLIEERNANPFFAAHPETALKPLDYSRVAVTPLVQTMLIVPGLGTVSAQGNSFSGDAAQSLISGPGMTVPDFAATGENNMPAPVTVDAGYATRALIVAPQTSDEAARFVAASRAHGFNAIWLDAVAPGVLSAAVAAGKAANLPVGAVVRVLRLPTGGDASLPADRNVLGETTREFAARGAGMPALVTVYNRWLPTPAQAGASLLRHGDWLVPDDSTVPASAIMRAESALAQAPGLSAVVLRDTAAPGYDSDAASRPPSFMDTSDGTQEMGFTLPRRVAFLRESHVDPIDFSLLNNGEVLSLPPEITMAGVPTLRLPFFIDHGHANDHRTVIGNTVTVTSGGGPDHYDDQAPMTRRAWDWARFRKSRADAVTTTVAQALRAGHPALPVWVQHGTDRVIPAGDNAFFERWGGTAAPRAPPGGGLILLRCPPLTGTDTPKPVGVIPQLDLAVPFAYQLTGLAAHVTPGREGLVVDLTDASPERALKLLELLHP